ncbi:hypothetical protein C3D80_20160 [Cronobacter sakazakii]|uniref:hypothetical protein n=1 Tax=Cronobacter sakazakii TaxID=28141 RepID=UPI0009BC0A54|nr:hypothetical protein [Cronobacter sakazakii]MDK1224526.1 hypothetical protein [Cronobacter turicensis]EJJ0671687.1 hypothetical protein [Cronobacter sakazakii]EMC4401978.1 hypothetical protein [Cronobacter sakazakii]KAB0805792.1 hypothetical protein FZI15_22335 [Cronobacter sakazakii]KAB0886647.1 hypothetical protein FZI07_21735 [Cronobacter sakazakii]
MITAHAATTSVSDIVFVNTQRKMTKKFDFIVSRNSDGSYLVSQQAYRVYPSGHEVVKSIKVWQADNIQALRNAGFMKNRQGKMFLETQISHVN